MLCGPLHPELANASPPLVSRIPSKLEEGVSSG